MKDLWSHSSYSSDENITQVPGETPEAIGYNYAQDIARQIDVSAIPEVDLLQAMREDAENWSDNPVEQGQYLYGLKQGLGL